VTNRTLRNSTTFAEPLPLLRAVRRLRERRARRLTIVSIAALVFAFSYLVQPAWDNERAHYDLTRALAQGSPRIDDSLRYPVLGTVDMTRFRGHAYANKAPGLAAVSVLPYLALKKSGVEMTGSPKRPTWALHLWSVVLPALVLLLLVRGRADRVERGFGTVAAVTLGASSLVLPFSTVFFSHVLSATLGFAAFVLLMRERETQSSWLVFGGGLTAGLAFDVDYSLGLVAIALGVVVLAGNSRIRRVTAYAFAVFVGVLPLLVFNVWAFRTPFHIAYEGWHQPGAHPLSGFFGISAPSLDSLLRIVFYPGGIGPILLPALLGAWLLWRRGEHLEASVPLLVVGLFLAFNSARVDPFGGASPGPRYMIPALPFLVVPLAAAYRAIPGATLGLAVGGGLFLAGATLTTALEAWDGLVFHRVITGGYVDSAASFIGIRGGFADAPFLLALTVAALAALAVTPWRAVFYRDVLAGAVALFGWLLLATQIKGLLDHGVAGEAAVLTVAVLVAACIGAAYRAAPSLRPPSFVRSTES
jgi:hypothetical protein